ncbi:MAG: hypothetical protein M9947_13160 [Thermomicrobiales bacterium]|nr:hypothetical protein [Verrucomicrobiae bacterium]MCO5222514.1 hypothetical protein [Thermomicrobiales bacterium]
MSNEYESKLRAALEKGKPVLEALLADLEREANLIKERDLDPRKLGDEPRVQEARGAAVDALEHLTALAKSLDSLVKGYGADIEKKIDVDALKGQLSSAQDAAKSKLEDASSHGVTDRIKATGGDARTKVEASVHEGRDRAEAAAEHEKDRVAAAASKGKDSTAEMLAALGWATAAVAVIYAVFMDEKRRRQARSVAKAAGSGLIVVMSSATKKS